MVRTNNISITLRCIVSLGIVIVLSACAAFPTKKVLTYPSTDDISVFRATRLAAQAMQEIDFLVTHQSEAAGYLRGTLTKKDIGGFAATYSMDVKINREVSGCLQLNVTCTAGKEVAFSTDPPKYVKQFHKIFDDLLKAEVARQPKDKEYEL